MTEHGFSTTLTVDRPPTEAFDAITDVRGWWSFDIAREGNRTEVRFTHQGLTPAHECFEVCSTAWGFFVNSSLQGLITTGEGRPNRLGHPPIDTATETRTEREIPR